LLHATWLRTLFDHGHHLNAVVVYSHEIDAATNAQAYLIMCVAFPVIGLFMGMFGAAGMPDNSLAAGRAARREAALVSPARRPSSRTAAGGWRQMAARGS